MTLTLAMVQDLIIIGCCVGFAAFILYLALSPRGDERESKPKLKNKKILRKTMPLIVGREYLVDDREEGPKVLLYFGKNMDESYDFVDFGHVLSDGSYTKLRLKPRHGKAEHLFTDGTVKWIPDEAQLRLNCPSIEEGGDNDKTKRT